MDERRTREEEIEYRRYLHRLKRREERRRKVMIARTITAVVLVLVIVVLAIGIRAGIRAVVAHTGSKQAKAQPTATAEQALDYSVPEGYEEICEKLEGMRKEYPEVEDILMNLYEYPENLLNLAVTNQETLSFVVDYPKHKSDIKSGGIIKAEELERQGGIPCLQQWDARWGYLSYGNDLIAIDGCGPTCLSMVVAGLKKDVTSTPDVMAEFSLENNYYTAASGSAWSLMSSGAKKQGITSETITIGEDSVKSALESGRPMICSMKPGDFTTTGHFIVLAGLAEDGTVIVNDPNSITRSETTWQLADLVGQMKAAWAYTLSSETD